MWLDNLWRGRPKQISGRPKRVRLTVECLEQREVPAMFTAATVPELIAAIDTANQTAEADIITLVASSSFTLTEVNNSTNGPTGLPVIAANSGNLTIAGNGDIIERGTATGTLAFRLFDIAAGASLTLENLTLQGGVGAPGGAIYNQGALTLRGVIVQNNAAWASSYGEAAQGGGIYSAGALNLENTTLQNNQALGHRGSDGASGPVGGDSGDAGGDAFGGGIFIDGGTALFSGGTLAGNTARGGHGGNGSAGTRQDPEGGWGGTGGNGFGGGLYAAAGSIEMHGVTVTTNTAQGGEGGKGASGKPRGKNGSPGLGIGGGLYIETDTLVCLDAFTEKNAKRNKASTSDANIHGSYTIYS
jgi:hypothetical protein